MRPVSFTYAGTVGSPIDRVFDLITDPARMPEWVPGCRNVTPLSERKGKGAKYRVEFLRKGKRVEAEIQVVDYNAPTTYGWVETRGRAGSKTFFALQFQGGATKITMKHVWTPIGWRAWLNGQFYRRRHAHQTFDGLLQNLRKVLMK